jgi:hypothetical protein
MFVRDARHELRTLGLRTPPEVVREAVQRLRNGESLYRLHSSKIPLIAKGTANKIKKLLDEGKLGFLFEVQPEVEAIDRAMGELPEVPSYLGIPHRWEIDTSLNAEVGDLAHWEAIERVNTKVKELEKNCPDVEWNIESLENLGIPLEAALELLVEQTSLNIRRLQWTVSDLQRFMELYYLVDYMEMHVQKLHRPPLEIVKLAAFARAKGEINSSLFLIQTAENMMNFQIWRGPSFLKAFNQSQIASNRSAKRLKREYEKLFRAELNSIIYEPGNEDLLREWQQSAIEVLARRQFEEQDDGKTRGE